MVRVKNALKNPFFLRSLGLGGKRNRASLVWMKTCRYDESEAMILARHQSLALFEAFVGSSILIAIVASNVVR
jgi:hypothetical protein